MASTIKVDTIENVAGSGNVSLGSGHNLVVPGNITGQGTAAITSNATVGGTLGVTGNTTVGGTLGVTGLITASAGIAIGGTGAVNTLDDYEEGTWTVVNRSIASITITNNSTAQYRKVGSLVFINFYITYPSNSDSNNVKINLPLAAAGSVGYAYCTGRFSGSAKSTSTGFVMQMNQGSDETTFYPQTAPQTAYINSEFSAKYMLMSGCYIAA